MKLWRKFCIVVLLGLLVFLAVLTVFSDTINHGHKEHRRIRVLSTHQESKESHKNLEPDYLSDQMNSRNVEFEVDMESLKAIKHNTSSSWTRRASVLRKSCRQLKKEGMTFPHLKLKDLDQIIVNDEHKVLYCIVPKVACTNLKRVFLILSGHMNTTNPLGLHSVDVHGSFDKYLNYLDSYSIEDVIYRIRNYRKMIVGREPLERLLSAYRNKFVQKYSTYFHQRFGRKIIKRYRLDASKDSLAKGHDVTFSEFIEYILDPVTREKEGFNEHWAPVFDLCHPCQIQYDMVGKYETINEDVDSFLREIDVDDVVKFPSRSDVYHNVKTEDIVVKYFKQVPKYLLNFLWKFYYVDYLLFDYPYPQVLRNLLGANDPYT